MTLKFAVMGSPIAHSLSPRIHQLFAAQFGIMLSYEKIEVMPIDLKQAIEIFRQEGGVGLNITAPLKEAAYVLCQFTGEFILAQSVNTLYWNKQNQLCGLNTDGLGLIADLKEHLNWEIKNKRILILGAGGAVAGILNPLLNEKPRSIVIANRTVARAQQLISRFATSGLVVADSINMKIPFDIVLNATGGDFSEDNIPFKINHIEQSACYDLSYSLDNTLFCDYVSALGASKVVNGLGMLIEQAALSFQQWHNVMPDTRLVRDQIKAEV